MYKVNFFAYWCRLLIAFANSLDPDEARQNVGPDLDPNCLTLMVFQKEFLKIFNSFLYKSMWTVL